MWYLRATAVLSVTLVPVLWCIRGAPVYMATLYVVLYSLGVAITMAWALLRAPDTRNGGLSPWDDEEARTAAAVFWPMFWPAAWVYWTVRWVRASYVEKL